MHEKSIILRFEIVVFSVTGPCNLKSNPMISVLCYIVTAR